MKVLKKNWIAVFPLLLNVVLLVALINQGRKLEEYKRRFSNEMANMERSLEQSVQNVSGSAEGKKTKSPCTAGMRSAWDMNSFRTSLSAQKRVKTRGEHAVLPAMARCLPF